MPDLKSTEKPLIAWVEDNRDYQDVIREWLMPRYDVVTYDDGEAFLDDLKELAPDLIMLDVRLPGPDGFKLCRKIRADERHRDVPILFLTSCEDDEAYIAHLDVGGTGFVNKPVDKKRLLAAIGELVDGARLPHRPAKPRGRRPMSALSARDEDADAEQYRRSGAQEDRQSRA